MDLDDELRTRLQSCLERCDSYGLTDDGQVLGFLEASYLLGEDFDSDPQNAWAADILRDQDLSGDQRIAMLVALARTALDESVEAADAEHH